MLSQLPRLERSRLETEIDFLLSRLGPYQDDPSRIERLAREIDQGRVVSNANRQKLWATLLRRRAICIRTANLTAQPQQSLVGFSGPRPATALAAAEEPGSPADVQTSGC